MNDDMQKTRPVEYPRLLSSEMVSLIESLGIIRRLVISGEEQMEEPVFCQRVTDSLLHLAGVGSSCVYLLTDTGQRRIACSNQSSAADLESCCPQDSLGILASEADDSGTRRETEIGCLTKEGRCMLEVPLQYAGERLGSIALNYPDAESFQPWHEQLFRLCADIVAQSLVTLRLLLELHQNLNQQDLKLNRTDATLRDEILRRESAESALLRNLSRQTIDEYLDRDTGLLNRSAFTRQLQQASDRARSLNQESFLLLLDIDHFKVINEVAGHEAGDQLLRMIAHLLGKELLPDSHCARLGTDEFGMLLQGFNVSDALERVRHLLNRVNALAFESAGKPFTVTASIGVVHIHYHDCPDVIELIHRAYSACSDAHEQHCGFRLFSDNDPSMSQRHYQSRKLGQVIRAIEDDTLELYCQPILEMAKSGIEAPRSGEILVRMHDEQGQLVSAGEILSLVERYGLSIKLDQRVLAQTLRQLAARQEILDTFDHLAINLSAHSISNDEFLRFLVESISSSGIDPGKLCFEITETAAILNIKAATRLIGTLKNLGCTFALDDFGSGHASYLYLRDLDVDYLKIDGEFIRNITIDPVNQALVKTMVDMGKILGKQIVAEFVENEATLKILEDLDIDFAQGYLIGRPRPLDECLKAMAAQSTD